MDKPVRTVRRTPPARTNTDRETSPPGRFRWKLERAMLIGRTLTVAGRAFRENATVVGAEVRTAHGRGLFVRPIRFGLVRTDAETPFRARIPTARGHGFEGTVELPSHDAGPMELRFHFDRGEDASIVLHRWRLRLRGMMHGLPRIPRSLTESWIRRLGPRNPISNRGAILAVTSSGRSKSSLKRFHACIDHANRQSDAIAIIGWAFHESARVLSASIEIGPEPEATARPISYGRSREDVKNAYGFVTASRCGFSASVPEATDGPESIALVFALETGETIRASLNPSIFNAVPPPRFTIFVLRCLALLDRERRGVWSALMRHGVGGNWATVRDVLAVLGDWLRWRPEASLAPDLGAAATLFTKVPAAPADLPEAVDVIIPVYNGREDLPRLFDSLLANTSSRHRLVIIDDCSPDQSVYPYLERRLAGRENAALMRNEVNLGFVGTANRGIELARRHVVLLNADVEVPPHWLERLMAPIFADGRISSTTPFTNSATICSFPNGDEDQECFAGLNVDAIDAQFACVDPGKARVDLPTGIGFCMGLNREALNEVGGLDHETFGLGYCEENDWCMRARAAGYRDVLVPNLFVYHRHGGSFGTELQRQLKTENLARLTRRHPAYPFLVERFVARDPMAPLRCFLILLLGARTAAEAPILIFDHELGGGSNAYRNELINDIVAEGRRSAIFVTFDRQRLEMSLRFRYRSYWTEMRIERPVDLLELSDFVPVSEILYNNLVSYGRPSEILETIAAIKARTGAPLTIAVHDYFSLCPSYTLLDKTGTFCDLPEPSVCRECLPANAFAEVGGPDDVGAWRAAWRPLYEAADRVLCFSRSSLELVRRIYDVPADRAVVRPHASNFRPPRPPRIDFSSSLHIGVVGAINYQKGREVVVAMAQRIEDEHLPVRMTVIGIMHDAPNVGCLTVTGSYERDDLPQLIEEHGINICLLPSVWPETFSYVTEEIMRLKMPFCCFDLGAPAERVGEYAMGRVLSRIEPAAALDEIRSFHRRLASGEFA